MSTYIKRPNKGRRIGFSDNDNGKEMDEEGEVDDALKSPMSCS
jgi:hypothetical protein